MILKISIIKKKCLFQRFFDTILKLSPFMYIPTYCYNIVASISFTIKTAFKRS